MPNVREWGDRAPALKAETFSAICALIHRSAGISMGPGKEALVISRLTRKLRETGCGSFEEYARLAEKDEAARTGLVDALTTNYTAFLREPTHFAFLKQTILPALLKRSYFSIWCAAAATGEEPYSLACCLLESLGTKASRARILATDISTRALAEARRAVYPASAFAGMSESWMSQFLLRGEGSSQGSYQVKPYVAELVEFRKLNLIESFEHREVFSLISCRNVMIYFDRPTQERLVTRLTRFLEPGGYLFIGHSESLSGIPHGLQYVQPAVYRKPGKGSAPGSHQGAPRRCH